MDFDRENVARIRVNARRGKDDRVCWALTGDIKLESNDVTVCDPAERKCLPCSLGQRRIGLQCRSCRNAGGFLQHIVVELSHAWHSPRPYGCQAELAMPLES